METLGTNKIRNVNTSFDGYNELIKFTKSNSKWDVIPNGRRVKRKKK